MKKILKTIRLTYEIFINFPPYIQHELLRRIFANSIKVPAPTNILNDLTPTCLIPNHFIKPGSNVYAKTHTTFSTVYPGYSFVFKPHHVMWWAVKGSNNGEQIQHECGIPYCREITHLTLGLNPKNGGHASVTRKPSHIVDGQVTWKLCSLDRMLIVTLRETWGLSFNNISSFLNINPVTVLYHYQKYKKNKSIYIEKSYGKRVAPPTDKELLMWVTKVLKNIKCSGLGVDFTFSQIQQIFYQSVGFNRSIPWYCQTFKDN
jgi:hypothetical protein